MSVSCLNCHALGKLVPCQEILKARSSSFPSAWQLRQEADVDGTKFCRTFPWEDLPRAERNYSMFRVRRGGCEEVLLIQGKEQRLRFAGAAVKRYPTSKVRETQLRW